MRVVRPGPDPGSSPEIFIGGSQEWYEDRWQRISGCGPTAAANLIWYMEGDRAGTYEKLQRDMFGYVTPGMRGVNTSGIFTEGVARYASERGVKIFTRTLEIPPKPRARPGVETCLAFLSAAIGTDSPVAFLNLSNGTLTDLENWHWVTILSVETDGASVAVCDQGRTFDLNFGEWLETSALGGALVYITRTA